jgi:D-alanyl-D-alanine carboxypeptidase/D-alanyl-D-alanine-endopeptidase (penicillin-binding protein 4)
MGMPRWRFVCFVLAVASVGHLALADLSGQIHQVLQDRLLAKAKVGVEIVRLGDKPDACQIIYEQNAAVPLAPASNMKLLTTAAALHSLRPEFRFTTSLMRHGNDLIIWGDGDPTLGDRQLMEEIGWPQTYVYDQWIEELKKLNITSVNNVIVYDGIFDNQFLHPRWTKHQFEPSGAEVAGLNFGANVLDIVVRETRGPAAWSLKPPCTYARVVSNTCMPGSQNVLLGRTADTNDITLRGTVSKVCEVAVTVHDPAMYAGTMFADMIKATGVNVAGSVQRDLNVRQAYESTKPEERAREWQVLCQFQTPLSRVLTRCNKESENMYAEALCKRMGAAFSPQGGSWAGGTSITAAFLKQLGVPDDQFKLDDGCGLSRDNRVTTNAMARVLMHYYYSPDKELFISTLPIGGVDGTLHKRFSDSLKGRVFAKTGFIANVSALSGYIHAHSDKWYAFSILMNGIPDLSNSSIKPLQEKILKALDESSAEE